MVHKKYRVLPNSTDKFGGVIAGIKKMKKYHRIWDYKTNLEGENRKNRLREDSDSNEESGQTHARMTSAVIQKKLSRVQISYEYGEYKSSSQAETLSYASGNLSSFGVGCAVTFTAATSNDSSQFD